MRPQSAAASVGSLDSQLRAAAATPSGLRKSRRTSTRERRQLAAATSTRARPPRRRCRLGIRGAAFRCARVHGDATGTVLRPQHASRRADLTKITMRAPFSSSRWLALLAAPARCGSPRRTASAAIFAAVLCAAPGGRREEPADVAAVPCWRPSTVGLLDLPAANDEIDALIDEIVRNRAPPAAGRSPGCGDSRTSAGRHRRRSADPVPGIRLQRPYQKFGESSVLNIGELLGPTARRGGRHAHRGGPRAVRVERSAPTSPAAGCASGACRARRSRSASTCSTALPGPPPSIARASTARRGSCSCA